jgi:hypothetical protein
VRQYISKMILGGRHSVENRKSEGNHVYGTLCAAKVKIIDDRQKVLEGRALPLRLVLHHCKSLLKLLLRCILNGSAYC